MSNNELKNKLQAAWAKTEPFRSKAGRIFGKIALVFRAIGKWIYRLRGLLMAIPVALAALGMAARNHRVLPDTVGILIQETGAYQWMVPRGTAVLIPLVVTGICLVLMFCSRRTVYPWLISIFSLVLPILIYITNVFPA